MNIRPIPTDDIVLHREFDCESISNMSSPILSEFSDIVVPTDNGRDDLPSSPPDPSDDNITNPDLTADMLPALDSFVPIIENLPGLVLENNSYHVDQPLLIAELQQLRSYTRRIGELILTDTESANYPSVAPETLSRLALIQDPKSPFLPSLESLHLVDANEALKYLFFCVTPSLASLEISQIPLTRHITIAYFLKELVLNVPQLLNITLGPGRLSTSSLQSCSKFVYLRELAILNAADFLDFEFLQDISSLPELESFTVDARTAEYRQRDIGPTGGSIEVPSSVEDQTPLGTGSSAVPFRQLRKLTIIANVVLIGDIICYLFPQGVEDVSLTLVQNDQPLQLPPHWNRSRQTQTSATVYVTMTDNSAKSPEQGSTIQHSVGISRENRLEKLSSVNTSEPVFDSASIAAAVSRQATSLSAVAQDVTSEDKLTEIVAFPRYAGRGRGRGGKGSVYEQELKEKQLREAEDERLRAEETLRLEEAKAAKLREERTRRFEEAKAAKKLRAEQNLKASNLVSQTSFFAHVIEKILEVGSPVFFLVDRLELVPLSAYTGIITSNPFEFPSSTFKMLLSYQNLKELQFCNWSLTSVDEPFIDMVATPSSLPMSMEKLQLPLSSVFNSGVTISTLHQIACCYPRLVHFECRIQQIPAETDSQFDLGTEFTPHGLEVISVGGRSSWTDGRWIAVATYLCLLFPHLKTIDTHEGYDANHWEYVYSLVKMCQTVRLADNQLRHRAGAA